MGKYTITLLLNQLIYNYMLNFRVNSQNIKNLRLNFVGITVIINTAIINAFIITIIIAKLIIIALQFFKDFLFL